MELQKVLVKVKIGKDFSWVHFCYVPEEIKRRFDVEVNKEAKPSTFWVHKWATEDFGVDTLDTTEDLSRLKAQIKEYYKDKYPEVYCESNTDQQGWLRIWCKNHMEGELENVKQ